MTRSFRLRCCAPTARSPSPRNLPRVPLARTAPLRNQIEAALPERPFTVRFWDGTDAALHEWQRQRPDVHRPLAEGVGHALRAPGQLGLGRAYVTASSRSTTSTRSSTCSRPGSRRRSTAPRRRSSRCGRPAAGVQRPPTPPCRAAPTRQAPHGRARRPLGPPPLRRRQRVLRALPRRHDDLQLRDLRDARPVARGRADEQARDGLPQARPAARRAAARRRLRLGLVRRPRRRAPRRPRHRDHPVRAAGRAARGARRRARRRRPGRDPRHGLPRAARREFDAIASIGMVEHVGAGTSTPTRAGSRACSTQAAAC